ncbi:sensor histidine kinase [Paenibacillus sedimenti]|uniref:histidine kinase n=1 Tax=Paenibacillus sedimenti TaxID=2770274 RepID=A0A926QML9_9BACL|nr:sensor histidine kinase KdpD [Paenibacillus sedimenti]MBD0383832.1 sensor histidine kinase KdpD [Paenibacillus sedimenti]
MESSRKERGNLTLFLGAAPGVGKTYAMLTAAKQQRDRGADVLLGWIEADNYPDTRKLASQERFNSASPRSIQYQGNQAYEMDTQEIIKRRPHLVLIDNLQHVNVPGSLKPKRYWDVEAILAQGIDVYTTLNIQHVESLNDIVTQIVGVKIIETVPDTFLEHADHIQLVDIPADELIGRFNQSYHDDNKKEKLLGFFRVGNLNALREMTFRYAAQRLDSQLEAYMHAKHIPGPWPVAEKLMVCVSASPFSSQLIRMGRQMAASLKSDWIVVYVQTPQGMPGSEKGQHQLARHLQLAEELGAEVVSVTGNQIAEELLTLARSRNVKQIIIGKPNRLRIVEWFRSSIVEQVIRNSDGINIHVIPGKPKISVDKETKSRSVSAFSWRPYAAVTLFIALLTVILHAFGLAFDLVNIALIYLFPVLFSAVYWGLRPSFYAASLGVLAFDFFFVAPVLSFTVADLRYTISFVVYLAVAALTASLAARLRQQLNFVKQREATTATLYALSRQMTAITDFNSLLENISNQISDTIGTQVAIYLPDPIDDLKVTASSSSHPVWGKGESEMVIARWVYEHGEMAGRGSNTLRESPGLYVPLRTEDRIYGVLAVNLEERAPSVVAENLRLLEAIGGLAASAIARVKLGEEAKLAHLTAESERIRTALLDSVSHELRTPLATIIGSATGLIEGDRLFSSEDRLDLLSTIRDGALRMNRLVTNLLGMVKLESGMLRLRKKWCDVEDIIGVVLSQVKDFQQHRKISVDLPENVPFLLGDDVLLEQVLVNVVSNAIKYSPDHSEIIISVRQDDHGVTLTVADSGIGIPDADRIRVFDKFYRADKTRHVPGTGLGLAICKGIIEAHGGTITAAPNIEKGTLIIINLPKGDQSFMYPIDPEGESRTS